MSCADGPACARDDDAIADCKDVDSGDLQAGADPQAWTTRRGAHRREDGKVITPVCRLPGQTIGLELGAGGYQRDASTSQCSSWYSSAQIQNIRQLEEVLAQTPTALPTLGHLAVAVRVAPECRECAGANPASSNTA